MTAPPRVGTTGASPHAVRHPVRTCRRGTLRQAVLLACAAWLGIPTAPAWPQTGQPDPWLACAEAASAAERDAGLPPGLLLAIGKVESGRAGPGGVVPWPYAINVAGRGMLAVDAATAVAQVRAAQAAGHRSVDVGCFQISLLHHPGAFDSLEAGFDPVRNARYAASFLAALRAGAPSWEAAASRYHSMTPELGEPYAAKVVAAWGGAASLQGVSSRPLPRVAMMFGMRVVTPGGEQIAGLPALLVRPGMKLPVVYRPALIR